MDFAAIFWAILGFLMVISEFFIPGLVIIFFGAGALLTALLTAIIPGLSALMIPQILMWVGFSSLSLISLRRYFKRIFTGQMITAGEHDYDDGGKTAKVLETIKPDSPGRISYKGTSWEARSFDKTYKKGSRVWILKKEGMAYYVGDPLLPEDGPDSDG
jgi:membrane protein implicated in regulation of membrane protease activity